MEWTESYKQILRETAKKLKGASRRRFMAQIVLEVGYGGQSKAEQELGWNRGTIRKGRSEIKSGITKVDNYRARGRKKAEWHLPNLLLDLEEIVDCNSQTDPSFKTQRLYTRLSAKQVREELIRQCNYNEQELPSCETIRQKLNQLGYYPQRVAKTQPQKKFLKQMTSLNNCLSSIN
jgi:Rhodopirellula transposase DDE domain